MSNPSNIHNQYENSFTSDINDMHSKFEFYDQKFDSTALKGRLNFLVEELNETILGFKEKNAEEVVDGLIDLIVVAIGTLDFLKVDTNSAWFQVHKANMAKMLGKNEKRPNMEGFDLIKPEGWRAPDHSNNLGILPQIFAEASESDTELLEIKEVENSNPTLKQKTKRFAVQMLESWGQFLLKKAEDYNAAVPPVDYFPDGLDNFQYMLHIKVMRVKSILFKMKNGGEENFESLEDSLKDLGIYSAMAVEYLNYKMDGQDPDKDLFGNKVS